MKTDSRYRSCSVNQMLHCFPNFVPGILPSGDNPDIAALIAPRALHLNCGELNGGSPIEHVRRGIETISRAYEAVHAEVVSREGDCST